MKAEHFQQLMPVIFAGLVAQRGPEFQAAFNALAALVQPDEPAAATNEGEKTDGDDHAAG